MARSWTLLILLILTYSSGTLSAKASADGVALDKGQNYVRLTVEGGTPTTFTLRKLNNDIQKSKEKIAESRMLSDGSFLFELDGPLLPGMYFLSPSRGASIQILLESQADHLEVRTPILDAVAHAVVAGHPMSTAYIRLQSQLFLYTFWEKSLQRIAKQPGNTSEQLAGLETLLNQQERILLKEINSFKAQYPSPIAQAFATLAQPLASESNDFPPEAVLRYPAAMADERFQYLLIQWLNSQVDSTYTQQQVDSALYVSIKQMLEKPMPQKSRQNLLYLVSDMLLETPYAKVIVAISHNEPLPEKSPKPEGMPSQSELQKTTLLAADGKKIPLLDKKTQYTLLIGWSRDCSTCMVELPEIVEWYKGLPNNLLSVRAICVDDLEGASELKEWIKYQDWPFPGILPSEEAKGLLLDMGFDGTPFFILLDRNGNIAAQPVAFYRLRSEITHILKSQKR